MFTGRQLQPRVQDAWRQLMLKDIWNLSTVKENYIIFTVNNPGLQSGVS
jgi:hypothetical protein